MHDTPEVIVQRELLEDILRDGPAAIAKGHRRGRVVIFNRGLSWKALANSSRWRGLFQFQRHDHPAVADHARLHVSMVQNVVDMNRLLTAVQSHRGSSRLGEGCACSSDRLVIRNEEACAPSGHINHPVGYPPKGRLAIWAEPCDFSAIE